MKKKCIGMYVPHGLRKFMLFAFLYDDCMMLKLEVFAADCEAVVT